MRSSSGTVTCSAAYFSRKPTPMNSSTMPTRASVLPPVIHAQIGLGFDGAGGVNAGGAASLADTPAVAAAGAPPMYAGTCAAPAGVM